MELFSIGQFGIGLVLLLVGAEWLVRGASRLAATVGISPLVIGLTVVAFGTSAPELAVSVGASLDGRPGIALGNIVGSNIFNILVILGISAMVTPLTLAQQLVRFDVPLMIGAGILMLLFSLDGNVANWEGALLVAGILLYTTYAIRQSRKDKSKALEEIADGIDLKPVQGLRATFYQIGMLVIGLVVLTFGATWMVDGAVAIATGLGMSELVIAITIVSTGTSLPEVATSVMASLKGERDIAVGNVVGSNIFNILAVLGVTSLVSPGGVEVPNNAFHFDIPVMMAALLACLPFFYTGYTVDRWEGALFLVYYIAYITVLILRGMAGETVEAFSPTMITLVISLLGTTFLIVFINGLRAHHKR